MAFSGLTLPFILWSYFWVIRKDAVYVNFVACNTERIVAMFVPADFKITFQAGVRMFVEIGQLVHGDLVVRSEKKSRAIKWP
jgi:hypothetical protein